MFVVKRSIQGKSLFEFAHFRYYKRQAGALWYELTSQLALFLIHLIFPIRYHTLIYFVLKVGPCFCFRLLSVILFLCSTWLFTSYLTCFLTYMRYHNLFYIVFKAVYLFIYSLLSVNVVMVIHNLHLLCLLSGVQSGKFMPTYNHFQYLNFHSVY